MEIRTAKTPPEKLWDGQTNPQFIPSNLPFTCHFEIDGALSSETTIVSHGNNESDPPQSPRLQKQDEYHHGSDLHYEYDVQGNDQK